MISYLYLKAFVHLKNVIKSNCNVFMFFHLKYVVYL